ncbi:hypothetical protein UA08_05899 [Talaromyces atroroseus]|uniref:Uncharacterized protein n=1 Tax=Talaromyces atroroseus TaxID=1441469 RepID=A0A225AIF0_TALAT|nr:hypothetical protein UA08_05899 [Talaromyces atroroseus]OKL59103.1 hypothetical protein UA08_05899 [Talaromyces atroroseus]
MSLQRWSGIVRSQCRSCARSSPFLRPSRFDTSVPTTTTTPTLLTTRYYAKSAPTSPAARNKKIRYGTPSPTRTWTEFVEDYATLREKFEKDYKWLYEDGRKSGALNPKLGPQKFLEIGRKLLHEALYSSATEQAVNNICPGDPDSVFDVGNGIYCANQWAAQFGAWVYKATARAGAMIPLAYVIVRQLDKTGGNLRSVETERMIKIAREKRHPLALRMWAEILWSSNRADEALEILTELVKITYPSNMPESQRDDITLQESLKPPWQLVAEIYNSQGKFAEADEMMKLGALTYRDPKALVAYAYLRKEEEDWEAYEQCLVVAATTNDGEACFRLANYYYNIFKGNIPSRDELNAKKNPLAAPIYRLFGQSRPKEYFRAMAMDWYELAIMHAHAPAIRNFSILLREDGDLIQALSILSRLEEQKPEMWNSPNIVKLRDNFADLSFRPELPPSWIAL